MRILTNMVFWQSAMWTRATESIFPSTAGRPSIRSSCKWPQAWQLWKQAPSFDVVVTMGSRESFYYGLLCALTGRDSKQILTEVFVDQPRPLNPLWHVKNAVYGWIGRRSLGILTNSSSEVATVSKRFRLLSNKVRYVPMHTNIVTPEFQEQHERVVLSAGYSMRDYATLLKAAPLIQAPVLIVCSEKHVFPDSLPANVNVERELPYDRYLAQLKKCAVVVLPLLRVERATGQVVLLEAMAYGKLVVATRSPGTADLIRDGENGLLIEPGDAKQLAEAVNRLLHDHALAERLSQKAISDIREHHTIDKHARAKLEAIERLWRQSTRK